MSGMDGIDFDRAWGERSGGVMMRESEVKWCQRGRWERGSQYHRSRNAPELCPNRAARGSVYCDDCKANAMARVYALSEGVAA